MLCLLVIWILHMITCIRAEPATLTLEVLDGRINDGTGAISVIPIAESEDFEDNRYETDYGINGYASYHGRRKRATTRIAISRVVAFGRKAFQGLWAKSRLLDGATKVEKNGVYTKYVKNGNNFKIVRDFWDVGPKNVRDDVFNGIVMGKTGTVGDRQISYSVYQSPYTKDVPGITITKTDRHQKVLHVDNINYVSN